MVPWPQPPQVMFPGYASLFPETPSCPENSQRDSHTGKERGTYNNNPNDNHNSNNKVMISMMIKIIIKVIKIIIMTILTVIIVKARSQMIFFLLFT